MSMPFRKSWNGSENDFHSRVMYAIGQSIGDAFTNAFNHFAEEKMLKEVTKKITSLWPIAINQPLFFSYVSHGYDDFGNSHYQNEEELLPEELAQKFLESIRYDEYYIKNLNKSLDEFASLTFDTDWSNYIRFETYEQKHERISEEKRKSLEILVANFARQANCKPGTMEFVQALYNKIQEVDDEYENYNSMERRMEEWMDHRYAGATEYYFENRDFTNSRIHEKQQTLDDAWTWLEENCPLLICKFKETLNEVY